jgi:16S rRNA (guanine527-N7)-methyltransferase
LNGIDLDPAKAATLRAYEALLRDRAIPLGLIAERDRGRIWQRHVEDSLRALRCLGTSDRELIDLGSGAGLPGIPLAVARPDLRVLLVEPKARRVAFLELVRDELGLEHVGILMGTHEAVREMARVCVVRALAPPATSWERARRLLVPGGRLIYFAGRGWTGRNEERLAANGVKAQICAPSNFPWQGPLVIMTGAATSPSPGE